MQKREKWATSLLPCCPVSRGDHCKELGEKPSLPGEATDATVGAAAFVFGHFCEDGWRRRSGNTDATCSRAAGEGIKI